MKVVFSATARRQLYGIVVAYTRERRSLGVAFMESLDRALSLLRANPGLGAGFGESADSPYRKLVLRRFPYLLVYSIEADRDRLVINTISHQRRSPDYRRSHVEEPVSTFVPGREAA